MPKCKTRTHPAAIGWFSQEVGGTGRIFIECMLGGAMREEVDFFYYMEWGGPEEIERQGRDEAKHDYHA